MEESFDITKPVSFRLPQDTPQSVQNYLDDLKKQEGRKYSSACASLFMTAINDKLAAAGNGERVSFVLPGEITAEQREWLNSPYSKQMLGQWIYQMLNNPGQPTFMPSPNTPAAPMAKKPIEQGTIQHSKTQMLARNLLNDDE